MTRKQTIALIAGGISAERQISLDSADQVFRTLNKDKYEIIRYDPRTDIARIVADAPHIDAALIILHGPFGEDGTVQGLLELLDIPYQGSGVLGSALAMNKVATKQIYEKADIPVPPYLVLKPSDKTEIKALEKLPGFPVVVKPGEAGSSVGMSVVKHKKEIKAAVKLAFKYDSTVLCEKYIDGIELTCGIIGNETLKALPLIEIIPDQNHDYFDYEAKYTAGLTQEICPARINKDLTAKAKDYAIRAHKALFCRGYSRTDMILANQEIYVLETNTIPGMTPNSLFPQAALQAGLSFSDLLDELIRLGIQAHKQTTYGIKNN